MNADSPEHPRSVIVLAGPNGAGKTTTAPRLLRDTLGLVEFVNADVIAQGLAGFAPEIAAMEASAIMLDRIRQLGAQRHSFAFETTMASRSLAPWLVELMKNGYEFHVVFLWLPNADFAIQRVTDRVRLGGHNVPEAVIRRRYDRGLRNFFQVYQPMATAWRLCDNTDVGNLRLIAAGKGTVASTVLDERLWRHIRLEYARGD